MGVKNARGNLQKTLKRSSHFHYYLRESREISGMIKKIDSLRFSTYNREKVKCIRHFMMNKFSDHF
jgi:hypothetical protein